MAYTALASLEEIRKLAEQDFVLFIEIEKPSRSGHDESTPTNSVDYIRAAGFTGASTVFGILDTGFMVGSAAPDHASGSEQVRLRRKLHQRRGRRLERPARSWNARAWNGVRNRYRPGAVSRRCDWRRLQYSHPRREDLDERGHRTEFLAAQRHGFPGRRDCLRCPTPRSASI